MTLRAIGGFSTAILTVAVLSAQAPSGPQDPTTFRSGVDLIEVDVIVTDREGNPVRDLTRDGFEIVEDGRSQIGRGQGGRVTVDADRSALREGFRTDFDLSRVTPGAYVLTLEARSSETGGRVVRRQIP